MGPDNQQMLVRDATSLTGTVPDAPDLTNTSEITAMPSKGTKTKNRKARVPAEVLTKLRRSVAYHEAGHAVTHYMLGEWTEFIEIDVNKDTFYETEGNWGTTRSFHNLHNEASIPGLLKSNIRQARAVAARVAVQNLSGCCVENIVQPRGGNWVNEMLVEMQGMSDPRNTDIFHTLRVCQLLYPDQRRRWSRYLSRMKVWTEELFAEPVVWKLTEALANKLQATDFLSGIEIYQTLESVNEDKVYSDPLYTLGKKWRRRFDIRCRKRPVPNSGAIASIDIKEIDFSALLSSLPSRQSPVKEL